MTEAICNFVETQTLYGLLSIASFLVMVVIYLLRFSKNRSPSMLMAMASLAPVLFSIPAAISHLTEVQRLLSADPIGIVDPRYGIQIAMELLMVGAGFSLFLILLSLVWLVKHRMCDRDMRQQ